MQVTPSKIFPLIENAYFVLISPVPVVVKSLNVVSSGCNATLTSRNESISFTANSTRSKS